MVGCLDIDGEVALEKTIRHSRDWMEEAWLRCGPAPSIPDAG